MDEELEKELAESYPEIFSLYHEDPENIEGPPPTFAIYGFECGDGWYTVIDALCESLQRRDVELTVVQVKEKFGGLRFYHDGIKAEAERDSYMALGAIYNAQDMSKRVCEQCGNPAELRRDGGWLRARCDECHSEPDSRRA